MSVYLSSCLSLCLLFSLPAYLSVCLYYFSVLEVEYKKMDAIFGCHIGKLYGSNILEPLVNMPRVRILIVAAR